MFTTRLPYTNYYKLETQKGKGSGKTELANYTTLNLALEEWESVHNCRKNEVKLSRLCIRAIIHCPEECPQWRDSRKKYPGQYKDIAGKKL